MESFGKQARTGDRPRGRTGGRAMRTAAAVAAVRAACRFVATRPDLASRGEDAGIGFGAIPVPSHENNRNTECTSEAERDAVGVSETRINTRLFTYGSRERGEGERARCGGGELNRLQSARCNYYSPHLYAYIMRK